MVQAVLSNVDKAAVLLRALTPIPTEQILGLLDPKQATRLRTAIGEVSRRKDLDQLASQVLREFQELRQQIASASPPPSEQMTATSGTTNRGAETSTAADGADVTRTEANTASVLEAVDPAVLAIVLGNETQQVIAIVLKSLRSECSAAVMKLLPQDTRTELITIMAGGVSVPKVVQDRILQAIRLQCQSTTAVVEDDTSDNPVNMLVGILQSVEREERMRLMGVLEAQNPTMSAAIDEAMYDYTDVLRIEDRSIQKILGQLDQKTLAFSLKTADEDVRDKIMRNMSERVKAALVEEMEFLSALTPAQADEARKGITAVIRTQDKEGSLVWVS